MMQTDLLIIGAGPGGYRAAEYAAHEGLQVVIVEQDEVGGTCLNRGCIPTKTYVHSASFAEAVERQQQVVDQLRSGVEAILSQPNITLLRGHAEFVDANTVRVGEETIAAKNIIIYRHGVRLCLQSLWHGGYSHRISEGVFAHGRQRCGQASA